MSTANPAPTAVRLEPASCPRIVDYLLIWAGVGASAGLVELIELRAAVRTPETGTLLQVLLHALPTGLLLPVGIILMWPLFYTTQWLCGRRQGLTLGEWLLGLAWLAALAFTIWAIGKGTGSYLTDPDFKQYAVLGYMLFMISMGALAVLIWLVCLVSRTPRPWTHTLSLSLMIWPAVPLLIVWAGSIKLE